MEILAVDFDELAPLERDRAIARFQEISEPPFQTLGAPRVGIDRAADERLTKQVKDDGTGATLADAKRQMHGYYVLELLPPNPGFPVYTSWGYEGVDRCTFRGAFLNDMRDLLGDELHDAAWTRMSAPELSAYGERLLAIARRFAAQHGLEHLEEQRDPPDLDQTSAGSRAHILFAAAKWCLWWSARGHGLEPYF